MQLVEKFVNENGIQCVNELDSDGFTSLHYAAYEGSLEIFK